MTKHTSSDDYGRRPPTYYSSTNTYTLSFDPQYLDRVLPFVIQAVAELGDTDPLQMEPVGSYVDVDDLERTLQLQQHGAVTIDRVRFPVDDYLVTVTADAELHVEPPDSP